MFASNAPDPSLRPNSTELLPAKPLSWDSAQLFQGRREVLIQHQGQTYRLQHTRNGRLILTK